MKKILWIVFIFVISIRIFLFFGVEKSLWLDEAALALNVLDKDYLELFQPLQYAQSAPPLFLCCVKFLTGIFGAGERVFRLIPFLCSIASIFGFYCLLETLFMNSEKKYYCICVLLLAFGLSYPLLYNTIEFKPYSADILFTILTALIWFKYLNKDVGLKKQIGFAFLLSIFPLFSFGSVFPICALLILSLFKKRKTFSLILISGLLLEYLFIFSKISGGTRVYEYWISYFINYNPIKAFFILIEILKYQFYPSRLILLGFVGFIAGCILLFKRNRDVFNFFILTIAGGFLASFFNFYPLYERLSLFLYPIILIIIAYPLLYFMNDKNIVKRGIVFILTSIFLLSTIFYNFFTDKNIYKREEIKPLLLKMRAEIKSQDKIFVFKGAHLTYRFYDRIFKFQNDTYICPYNMAAAVCANQIEIFCKQNTSFILYSSEIDTENNIKLIEETVSKLNGKILKKDKNAVLYKLD